MNLLEATTTLIDCAKTYAPENDKVVARAVRRMEKRLHVLQVRSVKARKRCRVKAFWDAMANFEGGVCVKTNKPVFTCPACHCLINFADFCHKGMFSGSGKMVSMQCPQCSAEFTKQCLKPI